MTVVENSGDCFTFELQRRERQVFASILQLYPLLNPDYHEVSRESSKDTRLKESQELLRDAMAHRHTENKKAVSEFLADDNWEKHGSRYRVKVSRERIEWLLQILNDVRVGSWVILGKPDPEKGERPTASVENMRYVGALELSGFFQMALLQTKEQ